MARLFPSGEKVQQRAGISSVMFATLACVTRSHTRKKQSSPTVQNS
jgi:hypothetical protein